MIKIERVIMNAELELAEKGFRMTKPRRDILNLFTNNPAKHYSLDDIKSEIDIDNRQQNIATIYNTVTFLVEEGIIAPYFFDNRKVVYELKKEFHAHFMCSKCKSITNIEVPGLACVDSLIEKNYHFSVEHSKVEFYGLCDKCSRE